MKSQYFSESIKDLEKDTIKIFHHHGYIMRPNALRRILEFLQQQEDNHENIIQGILFQLKEVSVNNQQISGSNFLEESIIEEAIKLCEKVNNPKNSISRQKNQTTEMHIEEINNEGNVLGDIIQTKLATSVVFLYAPHDFPLFKYDKMKQSFVMQKRVLTLLGEPEKKVEVFKERFFLVRDRLLKSSKYIFPYQQHKLLSETDTISISEVGSLIGSRGVKSILGILLIGENNNYFIEDLQTKVRIILDSESLHTPPKGFFLEDQIVIATGIYDGDAFRVKSIRQPESDYTDLDKFLNFRDYFGARTKMNEVLSYILSLELNNLSIDDEQIHKDDQKKRIDKLYSGFIRKQKDLGIFDLKFDQFFKNISFQDLSVVVISILHLNNPDSLSKFDLLLQRVSMEHQPAMFIITGELFSKYRIETSEAFEEVDQSIDSFLEVLEKHPNLQKNCFWVFIPAPGEFGSDCLPIMHYPLSVFRKLEKNIPLFINGSNPFRINIFNRQISVIRKDLLKEFKRYSIIRSEDNDPQEDIISTVLSQSHLIPLSFYQQPVIWDYDYVFSVLQIPDILILADSFSPIYAKQKSGKIVANPGNFDKFNTYLLIKPISNIIEILKI